MGTLLNLIDHLPKTPSKAMEDKIDGKNHRRDQKDGLKGSVQMIVFTPPLVV